MIIGHTYVGAMYLWKGKGTEWKSMATLSGHFKSVKDICWSREGEFLVSTSLDQTTRVFLESAQGEFGEISRA